MNKFIKPSSLLLYALAFPTFFIIGAATAGITGAAKGQGLAGGAIVFFYGMIGGIIALIAAIILAQKDNRKLIVRINQILSIVLLISISIFTYRYKKHQKSKLENKEEHRQPTAPKGKGALNGTDIFKLRL